MIFAKIQWKGLFILVIENHIKWSKGYHVYGLSTNNDGEIYVSGGTKDKGILDLFSNNFESIKAHKTLSKEYFSKVIHSSNSNHIIYSTWNGELGFLNSKDLKFIRKLKLNKSPAICVKVWRDKIILGGHDGVRILNPLIGTVESPSLLISGFFNSLKIDSDSNDTKIGSNNTMNVHSLPSLFTRSFAHYSIW